MSEVRKVDLTRVKPYGDILDDGGIELSFTLPVAAGPEAMEAARQLARKMGVEEPNVSYMHDLGVGYTFFVVFGKCVHSVDFTQIEVPRAEVSVMDFNTCNAFIREQIGRKVTVVGATTGTDAHTVGLDAIMNMKGYNGAYGLERYPELIAHNLGSQVPNERLVAKAIEVNADAILVSQVVTQRNVHIANLTQLVELVEAEGLREKVILICGGPRITHELAVELGYDAGFGPGTTAPDVASFIAQEMERRGVR
jgi:beta-lysine 5,6-aminomutase beta subunit